MKKFTFKTRDGGWELTPDILIPESHLALSAVEVFLPYTYDDCAGTERLVRWSEALKATSIERLAPGHSFFTVSLESAEQFPGIFTPKEHDTGIDPETTAALNEHMAGFGPFYGLEWKGLEEKLPKGDIFELWGDEHVQFEIPQQGLDVNQRIPQFFIDSAGKFAWGATTYPDSLYIAVTEEVCQRILDDERLDSVRLW